MKKLYLIIGLVLIASLCFAGRIQQYHMMIIGQEQGAAGCGSCTAGNLLSERFEAAPGYDAMNGSETVGTGCTADEDNTSNLHACGGIQNFLSVSASTGYEAIKAHDFGSDQATVYVRFYIYVVALDATASWSKNIYSAYDSSFSDVGTIKIGKSSGVTQISFQATGYAYDYVVVADLVGNWHYIEYKYDTSGNSSEWWVDGVSQGTGTATAAGTDTLSIGWRKVADAYTGTIIIDMFDIDSASQLGACS